MGILRLLSFVSIVSVCILSKISLNNTHYSLVLVAGCRLKIDPSDQVNFIATNFIYRVQIFLKIYLGCKLKSIFNLGWISVTQSIYLTRWLGGLMNSNFDPQAWTTGENDSCCPFLQVEKKNVKKGAQSNLRQCGMYQSYPNNYRAHEEDGKAEPIRSNQNFMGPHPLAYF